MENFKSSWAKQKKNCTKVSQIFNCSPPKKPLFKILFKNNKDEKDNFSIGITTLMAGALLTGCQTAAQKEEAAQKM
ncbi:MAG: hypothetical protein IPJ00_12045 [Saprospirales bacterium]|nr:hypothetical protein [Saprospirales bacterium]